jgi:DNA replication protein DnaC
VQRRITQARFPVLKTLEQFQWSWPKTINRMQVQNLFRLQFVADKHNVIFLGTVGLGKTHLATALGYAACLKGHSVRFATAVEVINTLAAAQRGGRLKQALDMCSSLDGSQSRLRSSQRQSCWSTVWWRLQTAVCAICVSRAMV